MRDTITIKGLGEVHLQPPKSYVAINDIISEYSANQEKRSKLARLSAAALGVCWSDKNATAAPVYDVNDGEIIAYGGEMLDWLMRQKVELASFYTQTGPLFFELYDLIPKEKEVADQADSFPIEGDAGLSGAEDSPGLESGA